MRRETGLTRQIDRLSWPPLWACGLFAAYVVWNAFWLASGKIPPSALRAILGVPCPTTGCTRAVVSLLHGDLRASLLWNPFTIPILILLGMSLQMLLWAALHKKKLLLPRWMGIAWLSVLLMAWAAKFIFGRAYW
jgi:hypothetical protein